MADDDEDDREVEAMEAVEARAGALRENVVNGAPSVRRDEKGRWLPGSIPNPAGAPKGSRRPRLVDIARKLCDSQGLDLDDALQAVLAALLRQAGQGDVAACKVALERLSVDEDSHAGRLGIAAGPGGPSPPRGLAMRDYLVALDAAMDDAHRPSPRLLTNTEQARIDKILGVNPEQQSEHGA
mgnify:CR=1 FL=1